MIHSVSDGSATVEDWHAEILSGLSHIFHLEIYQAIPLFLYTIQIPKKILIILAKIILSQFFLKKALFEKLSGRKSAAAHSPSPFSVNRCSQAFRNL